MSPKKPTVPSQSPSSSYSFHGANSSHSKDTGVGGRTYHIPNYATSYANDRSNLISVTFDEDKGTTRIVAALIVTFLLLAAVPLSMMTSQSLIIQPRWRDGSSIPNLHLEAGPASSQAGAIPEGSGDEGRTLAPGALIVGVEKSPKDLFPSNKPAKRNLHWDKPVASERCRIFGSREYTARLWNLPFFADWIDACKNAPLSINGIHHGYPSRCESKWPFGGVIGHWNVETEGDCRPHWGKIKDKGCVKTESRVRRFQARLSSSKDGDDLAICTTAPAYIHGKEILQPTICYDWGIWGVYGVWDLEDSNC